MLKDFLKKWKVKVGSVLIWINKLGTTKILYLLSDIKKTVIARQNN